MVLKTTEQQHWLVHPRMKKHVSRAEIVLQDRFYWHQRQCFYFNNVHHYLFDADVPDVH